MQILRKLKIHSAMLLFSLALSTLFTGAAPAFAEPETWCNNESFPGDVYYNFDEGGVQFLVGADTNQNGNGSYVVCVQAGALANESVWLIVADDGTVTVKDCYEGTNPEACNSFPGDQDVSDLQETVIDVIQFVADTVFGACPPDDCVLDETVDQTIDFVTHTATDGLTLLSNLACEVEVGDCNDPVSAGYWVFQAVRIGTYGLCLVNQFSGGASCIY